MPSFPNAESTFPTRPTTVNLVPAGHVSQPVPMVTMVSPRRDQHIQPIFTPYMSPAEVHKLAAPITTTTSPTKPHARTSQRSPRQQTASSPRSRGIASQASPSKQPIPSQPMTSPPQITSQVQRSSEIQPVNKPKPRQSKALVSPPQPVGHRGKSSVNADLLPDFLLGSTSLIFVIYYWRLSMITSGYSVGNHFKRILIYSGTQSNAPRKTSLLYTHFLWIYIICSVNIFNDDYDPFQALHVLLQAFTFFDLSITTPCCWVGLFLKWMSLVEVTVWLSRVTR
jgi:hypothetical protein